MPKRFAVQHQTAVKLIEAESPQAAVEKYFKANWHVYGTTASGLTGSVSGEVQVFECDEGTKFKVNGSITFKLEEVVEPQPAEEEADERPAPSRKR